MAQVAYCGRCGEEISATAKFCKHCGADQGQFEAEAPTTAIPQAPVQPPPPPEPVREEPTEAIVQEPAEPVREEPVEPAPVPAGVATESAPRASSTAAGVRETAERLAPGSDELLGQLGGYLRTPGVALAGLSALIGFGVCLAAGLLLALVLPSGSFLATAAGSGIFKETMAQATSFLQVNMRVPEFHTTVRTVPVLFVLIPVLGVAGGVVALSDRTDGMPARERMLWAAAAGIPFAFLMLVLAVSVGSAQFDLFDTHLEFSPGSVFLLGLLWGCLGGALGMLYVLARSGEAGTGTLSPRAARAVQVTWVTLRPLFIALLLVAALGTAIWVVQVMREDSYREFPPRSEGVAVVEQFAYAGDHGIDILPLGAGASERLAGSPAIPIATDQISDLPSEPAADSASSYNLFDFSDTMPAWLFVPMLLVLIAIPALLALYAGFALVRLLGEPRRERAAAWGALVGPVWAVAMVLLEVLARKNVVGNPIGDSTFVAFLLGGAVLGALGGLLASQGVAREA
ncbi:MAG: zinc ribbon domain-containing protein [Solirubrobacterales bacterium]